ncbi:MAG: DUF1801 domain-containing protein [Bacteroidota bacterium]
MKLNSNPKVMELIESYPKSVQKQLTLVRAMIVAVAQEIDGLESMEETLKWGEPSYLTKYGSTVRMDWKKKNPEQYALYFQCTSKLVPTFKILYKDSFQFEGNRAIVFGLKEKIPKNELKQCIRMALTYHKIKHLPLLGG